MSLSPQSEAGSDSNSCWCPPLEDTVKCNIDVNFSQSPSYVCISMCLHDSNGSFIQACSICISQSLLVHEGEALGVLEALQCVHELGYSKVIIEIDCKVVVDYLTATHPLLFEFGITLQQCTNLDLLAFSKL